MSEQQNTPASTITIAPLADHPEVLPTLVRWVMETWGALMPDRTADDVAADFARRAARGAIPTTLLALDDGTVFGMASLVAHDLTTRPELTPWMAAVFVTPAARNRGVGGQLVRAVVAEAGAQGIPRLYLITPDKMAFYQRLGWTAQEVTPYRGEMVTVMWIDPERAP